MVVVLRECFFMCIRTHSFSFVEFCLLRQRFHVFFINSSPDTFLVRDEFLEWCDGDDESEYFFS